MEIQPDQVPAGWTNDLARLQSLFYRGSGERILARCHGLTDFELILTNTPDTGEMGYILKSGKDFYWGDLMIDYIFKITKPRTLRGILHTLATEGDHALRMRQLKPVELEDGALEEEREEQRNEQTEEENLFVPIG